MPARSLTSSNRERNAPSISLSEQDGTHFLNSLSEKYLLIVYRLLFESAYMYYLCHCSKLTELFYKTLTLSKSLNSPSIVYLAPIFVSLTHISVASNPSTLIQLYESFSFTSEVFISAKPIIF